MISTDRKTKAAAVQQEAASSQDTPAVASATFTVSTPPDIDLNTLSVLIPGAH
jgi:hypothetical protein